ncbi:thiamine pyrophosphate-binding protein [Streptomyces sp. HSG2]|uniref:thiamine pyrophosphate-binding protein n=1 Tax=Streptomyces sp. HSG2 TaxID=2797167 RepID=UPI001904C89C|nr:thiamine pyrophosphate-binding protein [Streptomyces sp. HSG2]
MDGATCVVDALAAEGVDRLFMVPGGLNDPFMPPMTGTRGVRTLVAAHEGGAAYMADGYARASGRLGVAFGIGGPGVTNMVTALAAAKADRSPLLVVSGEVATGTEGRGTFQDASGAALDDISVLRPVTARSLGVNAPENLRPHLRAAVLTALRERAPVHLSLPLDVQRSRQSGAWTPLPEAAYRPRVIDRAAADAALSVFSSDTTGTPVANVVFLAGPGVGHSGAEAALIAAAERFEIPIATTLGGKGLVPEDHPLALGVFGYGGSRWATEAILDPAVAVLIVVGSGLTQRDTLNWDPKMLPSSELIHVESDPALIGRTWPSSRPVTAGPAVFLDRLARVDGPTAVGLEAGRGERRAFLREVRARGPRTYGTADTGSDAEPMHPARLLTEARAASPRGTVLAVDSGAHRAWCSQYWPSHGGGDYVSLTNLAPMGGAIPLGIGAKIARPERPLVVATGDGCMLMHGMELHTAARYGVPLVVLVFDNHAYGNIWYRAERMGAGPEELTDIPGLSWPEFARSMGASGVAVTTPGEVGEAVAHGLTLDGPFLISARIDKRFPTPVAPWREAVAEWEDSH